MLPATGWPTAAATCSLMLAMTWPAIAAVLAGLSENSSLPDRVSVTLTSGPSPQAFLPVAQVGALVGDPPQVPDIAGDVEVVGQAAPDQVGGPGPGHPDPRDQVAGEDRQVPEGGTGPRRAEPLAAPRPAAACPSSVTVCDATCRSPASGS